MEEVIEIFNVASLGNRVLLYSTNYIELSFNFDHITHLFHFSSK